MVNHNEDQSVKDELFVIELRDLLDQGMCNEAMKLFGDVETQGVVARNLWELVPILTSHVTRQDKICHRNMFETCNKLLGELAQHCSAREMILLLLEQTEDLEDEETFRCLLGPLANCLMRTGVDKVIDWCAESIKNYVRKLPQPENLKPQMDGKGANTMEERLVNDYESILFFLEPITSACTLSSHCQTKTRNYVLSLHLFLFGYPLCYLEMKRSKTWSELCILEVSLKQMALLTGNFLRFHGIIQDRIRRRKRKVSSSSSDEDYEQNIDLELFRNNENVSDLAYANYYYYLFNTNEGMKNIPWVYHPHYLMHGCFYLANCMLKQPEYVIVTKALKIVKATIEKIDKLSISHEVLEIPVHDDLFANLARVMIYCDADQDRKIALELFQAYLDRFTIRARYLILLNLYETANHSGFLALLTNITKSSIIYCLEQNPRCKHFLGGKLERLIIRICRLPNGSTSDLIEISDEVIAALNLIRFLIIRDKDNSTGIWGMIVNLKKNYLETLREGIDLAKAHWKIKIKDIEETNKNMENKARATGCQGKAFIETQITVAVGGQNLPIMPALEKLRFCRQAINALDIIKCIVIRVNECIIENSRSRL